MNKRKIIDAAALAAYSAFLLIVVLNHEYWFDEAQAWVLARDNDLGGIIAMMKYEGHPPLWHFILKIIISLGCSYTALGLVSWGISTLAAAVVLFALPIKPYFKAAILLSSGMLYINSAISRVYCLINLLLALIAWIYPHRKRLPVLFGVLVALLANTHISMCGLVGIIGIFMLIDYFKDFKGNSKKQNVLNTAGLAIAGIGVVVLIIPIWNSFGTNSFAAEREYTVRDVLAGFASALSENISCAVSGNLPTVVGVLLSVAAQALFFVSLFFLWKNKRAFIAEIVFAAVYFVINGAIWYTTECRGAVFILAMAAIAIMFRKEQGSLKENKSPSALLDKVRSILAEADRILPALCSCFLTLSIPSGVKYAIDDLRGEFAPHKAAAEFIRENIPEDALLVSRTDDRVVLTAYLPGREIYALEYNRFYTYCSHEVYDEPLDEEKLLRLCEEHSEVYYISNILHYSSKTEAVYENSNSIPFVFSSEKVGIYRVTGEELVGMTAKNDW
ncbi:MAG: hypothetical protein K2J77_04065 [Oscillospiraceae bacterium]|nr:hypothetical protein [Oscillospiraceae bacterium]